jgi:hypothetical protein
VDHAADADRAILRRVYILAEAKSAIYLDGSGYRGAEDFLISKYGRAIEREKGHDVYFPGFPPDRRFKRISVFHDAPRCVPVSLFS